MSNNSQQNTGFPSVRAFCLSLPDQHDHACLQGTLLAMCLQISRAAVALQEDHRAGKAMLACVHVGNRRPKQLEKCLLQLRCESANHQLEQR